MAHGYRKHKKRLSKKSNIKSKSLENANTISEANSGNAIQRRWKSGQACVSKPTVSSHRDKAISLPRKPRTSMQSLREHNPTRKQSKISDTTPIPVVEKMITDTLESLKDGNSSNSPQLLEIMALLTPSASSERLPDLLAAAISFLSSSSEADDWRAGCCTRKRAYRVLEAVFERARSAAALLTPAVLASLLSGGIPAPETNFEFVPECSSPSAERARLSALSAALLAIANDRCFQSETVGQLLDKFLPEVLLSASLSGANGQSVARRLVTAFIDASSSCSASRAESVNAFVQHMRVVLESVACATAASSSSASQSAWLASRPHVELVEASLGALDLCLAVERQRLSGSRSASGSASDDEALEPALSAVRSLLVALRPLAPATAADEKRMVQEQKAKRLVMVGLVRRALGVLAQISGALPHEQHTPLLPLLVESLLLLPESMCRAARRDLRRVLLKLLARQSSERIAALLPSSASLTSNALRKMLAHARRIKARDRRTVVLARAQRRRSRKAAAEAIADEKDGGGDELPRAADGRFLIQVTDEETPDVISQPQLPLDAVRPRGKASRRSNTSNRRNGRKPLR